CRLRRIPHWSVSSPCPVCRSAYGCASGAVRFARLCAYMTPCHEVVLDSWAVICRETGDGLSVANHQERCTTSSLRVDDAHGERTGVGQRPGGFRVGRRPGGPTLQGSGTAYQFGSGTDNSGEQNLGRDAGPVSCPS